eukprot:2007354-Rhodomonas_salina.1
MQNPSSVVEFPLGGGIVVVQSPRCPELVPAALCSNRARFTPVQNGVRNVVRRSAPLLAVDAMAALEALLDSMQEWAKRRGLRTVDELAGNFVPFVPVCKGWAGLVLKPKCAGPIWAHGAHGTFHACQALVVENRVSRFDTEAVGRFSLAFPDSNSLGGAREAILDGRGTDGRIVRVAGAGSAQLGTVRDLVVPPFTVTASRAIVQVALLAASALTAFVELRSFRIQQVADRAGSEVVDPGHDLPCRPWDTWSNNHPIVADQPRRTPLASIRVGIDNVFAEQTLQTELGVMRELSTRSTVERVNELMPFGARHQPPRRVRLLFPVPDYDGGEGTRRVDAERTGPSGANGPYRAVHAHRRALRACEVEQAVAALAALDPDPRILVRVRKRGALPALVELSGPDVGPIRVQGTISAQMVASYVLVLALRARRAAVAVLIGAVLAQAAGLALLKGGGEVVEAVALGAQPQLQDPTLRLPDRVLNHRDDPRCSLTDQPRRTCLASLHVRDNVLNISQTLKALLRILIPGRAALQQVIELSLPTPASNHRTIDATRLCGGFVKALAVRAQSSLWTLVARRHTRLVEPVVISICADTIHRSCACSAVGVRHGMTGYAVRIRGTPTLFVVRVEGTFFAHLIAKRVFVVTRSARFAEGTTPPQLAAGAGGAQLALLELHGQVVDAIPRGAAPEEILALDELPHGLRDNALNLRCTVADEAGRAWLAGFHVIKDVLLARKARAALLNLVVECSGRGCKQLLPIILLLPDTNRNAGVRTLAVRAREGAQPVGANGTRWAAVTRQPLPLKDGVVPSVAHARLEAR